MAVITAPSSSTHTVPYAISMGGWRSLPTVPSDQTAGAFGSLRIAARPPPVGHAAILKPTEVRLTHRWRGMDSNFQFLDALVRSAASSDLLAPSGERSISSTTSSAVRQTAASLGEALGELHRARLLLGDLGAEQIADDPRRLVPLALAPRARDWCGRLAELG
jgi:hypothetical protein